MILIVVFDFLSLHFSFIILYKYLYSDMWRFRRHITVVMIQINLKKTLTTVYKQQMALKYVTPIFPLLMYLYMNIITS